MPLFTASARAKADNCNFEVIQMVVAAYDRDHGVDLLEAAILYRSAYNRTAARTPLLASIIAGNFGATSQTTAFKGVITDADHQNQT